MCKSKQFCLICHSWDCSKEYHKLDGYHTTDKDEISKSMKEYHSDINTNTSESYCKKRGYHDYIRQQYCGPGDTNYLTCKICGHETTD